MRKTALTTAAVLGCLILLSCLGSDVVDCGSGDAFDSDATSPRVSDEGVTRLAYQDDAGKPPASGELAQGDAGDTADDLDAGDTTEDPDAGDTTEDLDAGDTAEDFDAGEKGDSCAGTWEVVVTPEIFCFRSDKPFILELEESNCMTEIVRSLDLTDPFYGHFVGTIAYSLAFAGDSLSGTANIDGVVTLSDTVTGPCTSTGSLLGKRRLP